MPKKRKRKRQQSAVAVAQAAPRAAALRDGDRGRKRAKAKAERPPLISYLAYAAAFLVATPALVGPYGQSSGYTPDLHMSAYIQVLSVFLLGVFVLLSLPRARLQLPRSPVLLPLLIFYAWAMLSTLWALGKYQAMLDALDWTGALLAALFVMLAVRDAHGIRLALGGAAISGAALGLLGIGQYLLGIDWVQQFVVPATTFSNKNMAGQFAILTLPIIVAMFLFAKTRPLIWTGAFFIAVICAFIVYTRAKGTWVAFSVEVAVWTALLGYIKLKHGCKFMRGVEKKAAAGAAIALFAALVYTTPAMLGTTKAVEKASIGAPAGDITRHKTGGGMIDEVLGSRFESANVRFIMWANSIPMFRDHFLIGVGLGNWTNHYATYQSWHEQDYKLTQNLYHANAHNDYIEILCELGVIGFGLFVWLLVGVFRLIGRTLANFSEARGDALMLGPIVALFGISTSSMFSFPLKQPIPIFLVMVYISLLSCHVAFATGALREIKLPPWPVKLVVAAGLFAVVAGLFMYQHRLYQAELHYRQAVVRLKVKQFRESEKHARLARELSPLRETLLWLRASSLMNMGRAAEAAPLFEEVLRVQPHSSSAVINLAVTYQMLNRFDDAADLLESFLQVQPSNYTWQKQRAAMLSRAGRYDESIALLTGLRDQFQRRLDATIAAGKSPDYYAPIVAEYNRYIAAYTTAKNKADAARDRSKGDAKTEPQ